MRSADSEANAAVARDMKCGAESTKPGTHMAASTKGFCACGVAKSSRGTDCGPDAFVTGAKFFSGIEMHTPHIVERAFQLAPTVTSVEEIRTMLRREGYSNVDAHLAGASIRADLKKRFAR